MPRRPVDLKTKVILGSSRCSLNVQLQPCHQPRCRPSNEDEKHFFDYEIRFLAIILIVHHLLLKKISLFRLSSWFGWEAPEPELPPLTGQILGTNHDDGDEKLLEPENPLKRISNYCSCGWCMCLQGGGGGAWRDPCRQDPQVVQILNSSREI